MRISKGPRAHLGDHFGRTSVLMTGFGPFPGVPMNATMALLPELQQAAPALFPGLRFVSAVLATEWANAPLRLEQLLAEHRPDLVLHFGVSTRARGLEVEARARNHRAPSPDAAGRLPAHDKCALDGAEHVATTLPVAHIVARLRRLGIKAFASRDAGSYLCNATLYHSLLCARAAPERRVGFIHVPAALGCRAAGIGVQALSWEEAIAGSLEVLAVCLRPTLRPTLRPMGRASPVRLAALRRGERPRSGLVPPARRFPSLP